MTQQKGGKTMHTLDVGVKKTFAGVTLQVVAEPYEACQGCYFLHVDNCCHIKELRTFLGACSECYRTDNTNVIFKEVTKNQ